VSKRSETIHRRSRRERRVCRRGNQTKTLCGFDHETPNHRLKSGVPVDNDQTRV